MKRLGHEDQGQSVGEMDETERCPLEAGCDRKGKSYFCVPCRKNREVLRQELKSVLKKNFLVILVKKTYQTSGAHSAMHLD